MKSALPFRYTVASVLLSTPVPLLQETTDVNAPIQTPIPVPDKPDALLWNALPNLVLNIAQTADLCGISVRQLGYWTKQGYVIASGRGARRCYNLDAIRRLLAIRDAMNNGASLRQSLRLVASLAPVVVPSGRSLLSEAQRAREEVSGSNALPPPYAERLAQNLLSLFQSQAGARDNISGLAAKLGRSEDDIRAVIDPLCARGLLSQRMAQGDVVFEFAGGRSE